LTRSAGIIEAVARKAQADLRVDTRPDLG